MSLRSRRRAPTRLALASTVVLIAACAPDAPRGSSAHEMGSPESGIMVRPDSPGNTRMFAFDASETVETYPSIEGNFLVHFTRNGSDAVPTADGDANGVPDYVEMFAATYEQARAHYVEMGFQTPLSDEGQADNGGDGRFDVYLVDFAGQGDGAYRDDVCNGDTCSGYTVDENDFVGYGYSSQLEAMRILGSHELFHAIQSSYDKNQGTIMAEGTAVWGTETFDPSLHDFESFLPGYLDNPDRPLDEPVGGATDSFSYGATIWFWFLEERFGDGTILGLWERCKNGAEGVADPNWFGVLDGYLQEHSGVSFADAFKEFATWNLFTGPYSDPARAYQAGAGYPPVLMEKSASPYSDDALRLYHASSQYFRVAADGRDTMSAVLVASDPAQLEGLKLILVDDRGVYGDVTEATDVTTAVPISMSGTDHLVVVAINTAMDGDSKKPGLCIGSPDELETCKAAILSKGTGGAGGGGGAGSTSSSGAGGGSGSDDGGGCGCRVGDDGQGSEGDAGVIGGVAVLGALAMMGRRRRGRR